jgi:hypothetical protein
MTVRDGIDYTEAALLADHAHGELVKALMDIVDLFDCVQGVEPAKSALRRRTGEIIRRSTVTSSIALGALIVDTAPEFSRELLERVDSYQEGGE